MIRQSNSGKRISRTLDILPREGPDCDAPKGRCRQPTGKHIVDGGKAAHQVELLEHNADFTSRVRQGSAIQAVEALSANLDLSGIGFGKALETAEQCCLS